MPREYGGPGPHEKKTKSYHNAPPPQLFGKRLGGTQAFEAPTKRLPEGTRAMQLALEGQGTDLLFEVYRDEEIGIGHSLEEEVECTPEDCESDEDTVHWEQQRAVGELEWALKEAEALGDQLTAVILRNPDIADRCNKPELFDRLGRIRSE